MLARDGWDTFCFSDVDVLPAATSSLLPWYITPPPAGVCISTTKLTVLFQLELKRTNKFGVAGAVLHFPFWHGNVSGFGAPSGGFLHCGVAMTKEQVSYIDLHSEFDIQFQDLVYGAAVKTLRLAVPSMSNNVIALLQIRRLWRQTAFQTAIGAGVERMMPCVDE